MNIAFHYLYRDGANYKNPNTVVFSNPRGVSLSTLTKLLNNKLIAGEYFYADDWRIPDMHFGSWDSEFDHNFHQFEAIEFTDDLPNSEITLSEFVKIIKQTNWE